MKRSKLLNDVLQGLLMAAAVAVAVPMPDLAFAQDLNTTVTTLTGKELTNVPDFARLATVHTFGAAWLRSEVLDLPTGTRCSSIRRPAFARATSRCIA